MFKKLAKFALIAAATVAVIAVAVTNLPVVVAVPVALYAMSVGGGKAAELSNVR